LYGPKQAPRAWYKNIDTKSDAETALMKDVPDKAAIGCFLWLVAGTRLDIAYAVQTYAL